jgi:23S rRNA pseudouridine1911/1915/1917 synthase
MNTANQKIQHSIIIPAELGGMRLDQAVAKILPQYSRALIQKWIKNGDLRLNQAQVKPRTIIYGEEEITLLALLEEQAEWSAQPMNLNIVYEDEDLLVINKPAGVIVHPGSGNPDHTLLNALIYHAPELKLLPRAGIIHRLDKDTSGLLVISKTLIAHTSLNKQLKARTIRREYQAIVNGSLISGGTISAPIARHPIHRKRMAIVDNGRPSVTHYRIAEKFREHTRLKVQLETGRTHQIRVHMAHIQHPIVGDPVYGGRLKLPKAATPALTAALRQFKRQALHAEELELIHPITKEIMQWRAEVPTDFADLAQCLRADTAHFKTNHM